MYTKKHYCGDGACDCFVVHSGVPPCPAALSAPVALPVPSGSTSCSALPLGSASLPASASCAPFGAILPSGLSASGVALSSHGGSLAVSSSSRGGFVSGSVLSSSGGRFARGGSLLSSGDALLAGPSLSVAVVASTSSSADAAPIAQHDDAIDGLCK